MEKLFDISVIKTLKEGIKKGRWTLKDAIKRGKFTLEDLDTPPPGWTECVNNCKGNPAFPKGYQGVEYKNLARLKEPIPPPPEEKIDKLEAN